jgi:hypothetical protein
VDYVITPQPPPGYRVEATANGIKIVQLPPAQATVIITGGAQGPAGSGDLHSEYTQSSAASVWGPIAHGLGKNPSVTTVDSAGTEVKGAVTYPTDRTTVTITFTAPFSGTAFFN